MELKALYCISPNSLSSLTKNPLHGVESASAEGLVGEYVKLLENPLHGVERSPPSSGSWVGIIGKNPLHGVERCDCVYMW